MKEFEIWMEGYAATGESSGAQLIGKAMGNTFIEACENFRYPLDRLGFDEQHISEMAGKPLGMDRNADGTLRMSADGKHPMCWACLLFDNEADARKSFG